MRIENYMYKQSLKIASLPNFIRPWILSKLMGKFVPLINTTNTRFDKLTREEVIVSIKNRRKIQNHIKGVHACAMALIAETSTGFVTNMNTPDDKLILLKSMKINYTKRSQGDMQAVATFSDEMALQIQQNDKGSFIVPVIVTDESGNQPIEAEMIWAWVPKKR